MQELQKAVLDIINKLKEAGMLRLALAVLAFAGSFLLLRLVIRLLNRRYKHLARIRGSLLLINLLIAGMAFFLAVGDSSLLRVVNSIFFFFIILTSIKVIDFALIEEYLIKKKKLRVSRLLRDTIKGILFATLFLIMLNSFFGISLAGIGITAAVATGVIGFALQDTLSSVIAGISISIEKPFQVGDWVKVSALEGEVDQISWRTTRIKTFQGDYVVVPNYSIAKTEIINYHKPNKFHARQMDIGVDYRHPPEQVKAAIMRTAKTTEGILSHPETQIWLTAYGDFSITYTIKFWINEFNRYPQIQSNFFSKLWYNFKRNEITIPFPIHDLRLTSQVVPGTVSGQDPLTAPVSVNELSTLPFFQQLPEEELQTITGYFSRQVYGKEEQVFASGETGDYAYFILRGSAKVVLSYGQNKQVVTGLENGDLFGEMSMISGDARSAGIITAEETELIRLHREDFKELYRNHPEIAEKITVLFEKRQKELEEKQSKEQNRGGTAQQSRPVSGKSSFLDSVRKYLGI